MPIDPMTSYEQAEAEADERFYEERDDRDVTWQEAHRTRQKALWNAKCQYGHRSPEMCPCIEACATCGHVAADHHVTEGHRMFAITAGECESLDCACERFTSDRDE